MGDESFMVDKEKVKEFSSAVLSEKGGKLVITQIYPHFTDDGYDVHVTPLGDLDDKLFDLK